jgi:hypothetical protein
MVELGTYNGVSYTAFCQAVLREQLGSTALPSIPGRAMRRRRVTMRPSMRTFVPFMMSVTLPFRCCCGTHSTRRCCISGMDRSISSISMASIRMTPCAMISKYGGRKYRSTAYSVSRHQRPLVRLWRLAAVARVEGEVPAFRVPPLLWLGVIAVGSAAPQPVAELCRIDSMPEGPRCATASH